MSHVATAMIKGIAVSFESTHPCIVVERGQRGESQLLRCPHLIEPEEGLQVVAHIVYLTTKVATLALHQEEHATASIIHALSVCRWMKLTQVLQVNHTFIGVRDN